MGLHINRQDTKTIVIEQNDVNAGGAEEYKRTDFVYLGSTVFANSQLTKEVKARIHKAHGSFSHLPNIKKSKKINLHTKVRLYILETC